MAERTISSVFVFLCFMSIGSADDTTDLVERVRRATVFINHFDGKFISGCSGVVIEREGDRVVLATCAHAFHAGDGPFEVEVTFFTPDGPVLAMGRTTSFDRHLDVGFVVVPNAPATPVIPMPTKGRQLRVGEKVVASGCDGGGYPKSRVRVI